MLSGLLVTTKSIHERLYGFLKHVFGFDDVLNNIDLKEISHELLTRNCIEISKKNEIFIF